jgi:hypothetical protein
MKQQFLDRSPSDDLKRNPSLPLYLFTLALEAGLLYCGFNLVLLHNVPPYYRLIGASVIFPSAVMSAWWGGYIFLRRRGEERQRQHPISIFNTLSLRILFGVLLAALVVSIFSLLGNL